MAMQYAAVTAVGKDRPGIVAGFSGALYRLGCNLEETTMTRLRGEFAMLLLVRLPESGSVEALRLGLEPVALSLDLSLGVRELQPDEAAASAASADGYILRVYGADRPGIVYAVTSALANRGMNITDLNTRVIPGEGGPVYVLVLEVDSAAESVEAVAPELERLRRELDVEIAFEPLERETL